MDNRNYILDRIKSKVVSIDEFNYDKLQAPPIAAMFTAQDIMQLNSIAKSVRYSGNPELKLREIDKIMRSRGFVKFVNGTNRVAYRAVENTSFLVKVAIDAVGLGDNPREFRNQFIFKPFVTKVFEVTPCGTLGVFERVVPITSREEFASVAKDVFEVVNKWFIGEYVLEDIGTEYFMNWGIRKGFGPVLLDFPYVYKLDGDKLFCNAPSNNTCTGCCDGIIDYDPGYNFLYCTKCGVKYKAKELEKAVQESKIIVKSEGEHKMKVRVSGGTKNVEKEITTGQFAGLAKSMPSKEIKGRSEMLSNTAVKAATKNDQESEEVVEAKREVTCPIEFDDSLKTSNNTSVSFEDELAKLEEMISDDKMDVWKNFIIRKAEELKIEVLNNETSEYDGSVDVEETEDQKKSRLLKHLSSTLEELEQFEYTEEDWKEILDDHISLDFLKNIFIHALDNYHFEMEPTSYYYDEETNMIVFEFTPLIADGMDEDTKVVIWKSPECANIQIEPKDMIETMLDAGYTCNSDSDTDKEYAGLTFFASRVINVKDLFPNQQPNKVIVMIDENGNYITNSTNDIIAIDMIDDRSVQSCAIVSQAWLDNCLKVLDSEQSDIDDKESESESSDDTQVEDSNETPEESSTPTMVSNQTGVLPPVEKTVNGVPCDSED